MMYFFNQDGMSVVQQDSENDTPKERPPAPAPAAAPSDAFKQPRVDERNDVIAYRMKRGT